MLLQELDDVRRLGYAMSVEEHAPGLASIAVGIGDVRGRVIAALAVLVPAERLDARRTERIVLAMRKRAKRIEDELGSARDASRRAGRA